MHFKPFKSEEQPRIFFSPIGILLAKGEAFEWCVLWAVQHRAG